MIKGSKIGNRLGIALMVLVALLLVVVVACQAAPASTPATQQTTPQVEQPKIKIGVFGPMKALHGPSQVNAATIAVEEINKAGGVNVGGVKRQLELVSVDSNEWVAVTDATAAMERLLTVHNVDFIIGANRSEANIACLELTSDAKKIWLGTGSSTVKPCELVNENYDRYKYWFKLGSVDTMKACPILTSGILEEVLPKIEKETGIKPKDIRVAYLVENSMWTSFLTQVYDSIMPKFGLTVVGTWKPAPNATDVNAELTAIRDKGAHIILGGAGGSVSVVIPKMITELKIPVFYGGISGQVASYEHWKATSGACEYEWTWNMIDFNTMPGYYQRFGDYPINTACTYDCIYVIKEAVERSGTINPDSVVLELEKTNFKGASGVIQFSPKTEKVAHHVLFGPTTATAYLQQWQKGVPEVIWPNGKPILGDQVWANLKSKGYKEVQLPPWMTSYWKGKS